MKLDEYYTMVGSGYVKKRRLIILLHIYHSFFVAVIQRLYKEVLV
ncbi:hypothetical protein G4B88_020718 [Cannabis sativa]|uniref:Uncharacterized protein n=1 Tax=Cannabis sativa TaxID=3483 RepID=A0A7J6HM69_CANSA|nr:hypothetical protein G4B88_020718 [Cannabis sativa]